MLEFAGWLIAIILLAVMWNDRQQLKKAVDPEVIARKLDKIINHLSIEYDPSLEIPELMELIAKGKQLQAIRKYHEYYPNVTLQEAKEEVDKLKPSLEGRADALLNHFDLK